MVLLRRIYKSPELFQLLATFGLTLMVEDIVVLIWGPDDLVGRRAPGFRGVALRSVIDPPAVAAAAASRL